MIRQKFPLGGGMGIPLGLDYSWFVIFVLRLVNRGENRRPNQSEPDQRSAAGRVGIDQCCRGHTPPRKHKGH